MGEIKKLILDGETIHVKKGIFGWNIVLPWRDENGNINWFNFITGGWGSLMWMGFILLLLLMFYMAWKEMADQAVECFSRNTTIIRSFHDYSINLSGLNFSTSQ